MPVRYVIHKKLRLVLTIGEGAVTFDEIKAHQDRLLSDPDFDPSFNQLIDVTGATTLDLSAEEAKQIARRRIVSSGSRRAYVAKSPHIFGMGRLMEVYHEQHAEVEVHIFDDRDAALKWLGIEQGSGPYGSS
jgi:hypothetical protein